ncbi:MAG: biotin--[acetyl-CoA-carboxylase] ligase [Chloroflexi bacterium]|nr:biotin--[acetyl-CoA-carboxylase] ligase [Chloroflexota bacterium]
MTLDGAVGLDIQAITGALRTAAFGRALHVLHCVSSTNDVLQDLARRAAPEGTVVVAEEQTMGRGRLGRRWEAPPGACLLCSVLFRPRFAVDRANRLTMLVSLAMADAVTAVSGLRAALKWPNDLVVLASRSDDQSGRWRKLAGVLTESAISAGQVDSVVVGVGVNVNVPVSGLPDLAPDATSILAETGRQVSREELLVSFLEEIERRYQTFGIGNEIKLEWIHRLATLGQEIIVTTSSERLVGWADSVDDDGALLLRTSDGRVHRLMVGDVISAHGDISHLR